MSALSGNPTTAWFVHLGEVFGLDAEQPRSILSGQVNEHWHVSRAGQPGVLRRYAAGQPPDSIAWEHALLRFMAGRDWPVAPASPASDGSTVAVIDGRSFSLFPFLAGEPGEYSSLARRELMGRLLARFHTDAAGFPAPQRPGLGRAWELDALASRADGLTFNQLLARFGAEHGDLARAVRAARYRNLRELAKLGYGDLPDVVVHADFHRDNLLFDSGEVTGLLDFDWAHRDAAAYDIANTLWLDCMAPPAFNTLSAHAVTAFIHGYAGHRQLTSAEAGLLVPLIRSSLLWFVTFRLGQWAAGGMLASRAVASIARTVTGRLPALDSSGPSMSDAIARAGLS